MEERHPFYYALKALDPKVDHPHGVNFYINATKPKETFNKHRHWGCLIYKCSDGRDGRITFSSPSTETTSHNRGLLECVIAAYEFLAKNVSPSAMAAIYSNAEYIHRHMENLFDRPEAKNPDLLAIIKRLRQERPFVSLEAAKGDAASLVEEALEAANHSRTACRVNPGQPDELFVEPSPHELFEQALLRDET